MRLRFGNLAADGPVAFLTSHGYRLNEDRTWEGKPGVYFTYQMEEDEFQCLSFLVLKWDYGEMLNTPSKGAD